MRLETPGSADPELARPAAGMHLFILDHEGLLFSEAQQEIHVLNTSATVIWCHLEEGMEASGIATELQSTFGLEEDEAHRYVATALANWRDAGFLAGAVAPSATMATDNPPDPAGSLPPFPNPSFVVEQDYAILSSRLRMRFTTPELAETTMPVLSHLEIAAATAPRTNLDIVQTADDILLYRDQEPYRACKSLAELAPLANGLFWTTAVEQHNFFLDIHAGVVAEATGCVLLPGPPGSGKSMLSAALMRAGFDFFSDEVALLEDGSFRVIPVPLAICIKDTGIDALAPLFPQIRQLPLHLRGDGKRVAYLPLTAAHLPPAGVSRPARAIIFPNYREGAGAKVRTVPITEAVRRLLAQCVVVSQRLDASRVRGLIDWLGALPCHELIFSSLSEAVESVQTIVGPPRSP